MNDTAPWAEAAMAELWRRRSGSERVVAACQMFTTARRIVIAGLQAEQPGLTDDALRTRVLERTYAADFTPEAWSRMVALWHARLRR